jgi:hypothetical protein
MMFRRSIQILFRMKTIFNYANHFRAIFPQLNNFFVLITLMKGFNLLIFLFPILLNAQAINGVVTEKNNSPVADVNILNLRSGNHTHSDQSGKFILNGTQANDSLQITHLGYKSRYFVVPDSLQKISIVLIPSLLELDKIVVIQSINALNHFTDIDLRLDPVNSSQEVLRTVPGMIIGQHAGGGKAEQIFLRGFDLDHGTDINITVNELPVNMVSHAHGQGYADLHFLIPETIKSVDFGKGPYYTNKGNFATAGYVNFKTYDKLPNSQIFQEIGQFNTLRTVGVFNLLSDEKHQAYAAGELHLSDGPFESPQDFNRVNLMTKYNTKVGTYKISFEAMHFQSDWNASGQIPMRAVEEGLISRFGAIDDTEGGNTGRSSLHLKNVASPDEKTTITNRIYYSAYDFELYSNFTFFLNDPVNGDQIKQKEQRSIYGFESIGNHRFNKNIDLNGGIGFRHDEIKDNELSRTKNRIKTLSRIALGDIKETNFYGFASADITAGHWLINPSVRLDHFNFYYEDRLDSLYNPNSEKEAIVSPKLNIVYTPTYNWQIYAKSGIGFHSNDTRVVVAQNGHKILPSAYGNDLGIIWKADNRLLINAALWHLFLQQEFVYLGDEGIIEPSGKTQRLGFDFSLRYQFSDHFFLNTNFNYAHGRSIDEPDGENYIPLAPNFTSTGGLYYQHANGISGALSYRFVNDVPANEDNNIKAEGYFITDLNLNYSSKHWIFSFIVENIFDTEWNEARFATESRLFDEHKSIEEIHFTPGMPLYIRGRIGIKF